MVFTENIRRWVKPEVREEEQSDNDSDDNSDDCECEDLENVGNSLYSHDLPMTWSNLGPNLKALNDIKNLFTKRSESGKFY